MEMNQTVKVINPQFGELVNENFVNPTQFKLFLKLVNSCLEMKQDLTFFNGQDFLIHIPYDKLKESIITTKLEVYTFSEHIKNKSKIEALETK